MVLRAVLYDLDGVLIDSMNAWFRVMQRGVRLLGRDLTFEDLRRTFGQGVEADRVEFFPEWTAEELSAFYERTFPEELDSVALATDAARVLDAVRARGLRQGLVTNTPLPLAEQVLARTGLRERLDALACAGEAAEKPAPDLVHLALRRLGIEASQALYVGDSATDREAARAAGVRFAGLGIDGDLRLEGLAELVAIVDDQA